MRKLVFVLAAALMATACGGGAAAGEVTLTLGDQVKTLETLLDASKALDGAPFEYKWAQFQGAAPLFEAVKAGSVDTAVAADLPTLQAQAGRVPVKSVAAVRNSGVSTVLLVQPDSAVHQVADLKGKDVVVSSAKGSIAEYLLVKALQEAGLSYSDVHVRYLLPTDAQAAFSGHKIDVWATFGVYGIKALQDGASKISDGTNGRTSGVSLISAATNSLNDQRKRTAINEFLKRVNQAYQWGSTHRAEYVSAVQRENRVDEQVAAALVDQGYAKLEAVSAEIQASLQQVSDTMSSVGALTARVDVASITDSGEYEG